LGAGVDDDVVHVRVVGGDDLAAQVAGADLDEGVGQVTGRSPGPLAWWFIPVPVDAVVPVVAVQPLGGRFRRNDGEFVRGGYVAVRGAVSAGTVAACRS
jgi:hypothetical protein